MSRLRFGAKEIIATLSGCALFVLVEWIEKTLIANSQIPGEFYFWVQLRVLVIAIAAVFFGPISGMMCGLGGDLLVNAMFESYISYPEVLVLGLYGLIMGAYYGSRHYDSRHFTPVDFMDFNAVSIVTGIFCAMFFVPLARFFIERAGIGESILMGARSVIGNSILIGIVCPVIMAIVCAVRRHRA